ncbi:MAG TPA: hypothetical protein VFU34_06020 [Gaiellaceae bacterium]|nr:hypothetical protein [Gaiellaceae bacterium]
MQRAGNDASTSPLVVRARIDQQRSAALRRERIVRFDALEPCARLL